MEPTTINLLSQEMLCHCFSFCTPIDNARNTAVCKNWRNCASEVAKKQFIAMRQQEIERQAKNFLRMVPEKLEFYCTSYEEKLQEIQSKIKEYSIKEVYDFLQTKLTERQQVSLGKFLRLNPDDPEIPANRREQFAGKAFVELYHLNQMPCHFFPLSSTDKINPAFFRRIFTKIYFPIELFNLTLSNENGNNYVHVEKNQGSFCFAFCGRVIELAIVARIDEGALNVFYPTNSKRVDTVPLAIINANWRPINSLNIYVAEFDAHKPKEIF